MTKVTGIMFNTLMVQADDAGRKTQTRRTAGLKSINETPNYWEFVGMQEDAAIFRSHDGQSLSKIKSPYGGPGDVLWRREAFGVGTRPHPINGWVEGLEYKADEIYLQGAHDQLPIYWNEYFDFANYNKKGWKPAIHMPKEACRRWMRIKDIYPQRLQDISEQDAVAEGVEYMITQTQDESPELISYKDYNTGKYCAVNAVASFRTLIQSINNRPGEPDIWEANHWVWMVKYEDCGMPEDFLTSKTK